MKFLASNIQTFCKRCASVATRAMFSVHRSQRTETSDWLKLHRSFLKSNYYIVAEPLYEPDYEIVLTL